MYPDSISVYTRPLVSDDAGGESLGDVVSVYSALPARISVLQAKDELKEFGTASGRYWKVMASPAPLINYPTQQYFVQVLAQTSGLLITGREYQVVKARQQRTENSSPHHTTIFLQEASDG